jgi:hypothetical protein
MARNAPSGSSWMEAFRVFLVEWPYAGGRRVKGLHDARYGAYRIALSRYLSHRSTASR